MVTGTFTSNALRTKTLKERIKTQRKIDKSNAVIYAQSCPVRLVWLARCCGKMYSRHLFSYGGFLQIKSVDLQPSR